MRLRRRLRSIWGRGIITVTRETTITRVIEKNAKGEVIRDVETTATRVVQEIYPFYPPVAPGQPFWQIPPVSCSQDVGLSWGGSLPSTKPRFRTETYQHI